MNVIPDVSQLREDNSREHTTTISSSRIDVRESHVIELVDIVLSELAELFRHLPTSSHVLMETTHKTFTTFLSRAKASTSKADAASYTLIAAENLIKFIDRYRDLACEL